MGLQGFRPLDRGEMSILAAFSLVVVLAGVGLFFRSFSGANPTAQTAAPADAVAGIKQECLPGYVNQITIQKGSFSKAFVKDQSVNCYDGGRKSPNPAYPQCKDIGPRQCQVIACPPGNKERKGCSIVGTCNVDDPGSCNKMLGALESGAAKDVFSVMQQYGGDLKRFTELVRPGSPNGSAEISAAFASPLAEAQRQVREQVESYDAAIKGIQDFIGRCGADTSDAACADLAEFKKQEEQLRKEQAELKARLSDLADAQRALSPNDYQGPCPSGTTGYFPNCVPKDQPCTAAGCGGAGDIIKGIGDTFGKGGLNSLLGGLSRGLAAPARPATSAAIAQACSTDPNAYAQQQQQYQQQLQQYNYQLQQYQYQQYYPNQYVGGNSTYLAPPQPPSACTPSTQQQCSLQPQQPEASACAGGSWQPVRSGNCVVGWQCSNLGAQLSCQPKQADVGMTLAISYSCSRGTASGSGFTASGQSGTTTVVVAEPPQGTDIATYTLTCTEGAITSGAQCSIQVARPVVVFVANPESISSGGTSQLGWLTTGMRSCIVSSPDDPTFTAQNASNTSVAGTATTLPASATRAYLLRCETLSGSGKDATVTVTVR